MLLKTLQIVAVLATSACFAQNVEHVLNNQVIDALIANNNNCVVGCSADKVYLNPSKIFPTEQGLYLNINNEDYVLLPELNSNSQGCYVSVTSLNIEECGSKGAKREKMWQCPYCLLWWELGDKCKNDDCPTNRWEEKEQKGKKQDKN